LVDARAGERYRGETEPLDTRAGHIPGAVNRFFKHNLQPDGHFKSVQALRDDWLPLLQSGVPVVHQCGSGVTACHNLLALAHAGLGEGVLYPGSWSEWSADPSRPMAQG
jgi:thiosulfate/3-mercaptopyruvate sulfurtransferase